MADSEYYNAPAPGVPYFTPAQDPPAGTAFDPQPDGKAIPKLFQSLKIRGVEFHNRIWLSPLCQYSAKNGVPNAWHSAHLGGIFTRGPGLTIVEASAVTPEGRITPEDCGIWSEEQVEAWSAITAFAHSQSQKIGIQIAHAGRKASTVAPWLSFHATATKELDGWPDEVYAPSAIVHSPGFPQPKELTKEGIQRIKQAFVDGAKRAIKAGFDVIEIHGAHGYLLHEFVSPVSNQRTDEYGGSFENRTRLPLEIVDAVRAVIPESTPLFYRLSATDGLEEVLPEQATWSLPESIEFAKLLAQHGVDLLDVSSLGNHPQQKVPSKRAAVHADLSGPIKAAVGDNLLVAVVGGITSAKIGEEVLEKNEADAVLVGRGFQKNPGLVWQFADELGVVATIANQIAWAVFGRGFVPRKRLEKSGA
ncbi:FMN-linked oxidoreductase [Trametopsis cervina]|nr:FMN-linked oxidoreductase [Trametopsis cervina]